MAQWYGQFSGSNLLTKVEDAEDRLREAAASFDNAPAEDRSRRVKQLRHLAQSLLRARLQLLKTRLGALQRIPMAEALEKRTEEIQRLKAIRETAIAGGVDAILVEFDLSEIVPKEG